MPELALKVVENRQIAAGTLGLKLELPPALAAPGVAAGTKPFSFKPGQYAMITLGGEEARAFSIANSPTRPGYLQFATRDTGSAFKKLWAMLQPGDSVKVFGPLGRFIFDETNPFSCFLSGGIGITPLKSMLEYACDKQLSNKLVLLYSNRKPEDIPYKNELDELAASNPNLKIVHTLTQAEEGGIPEGCRRGNIGAQLVREILPNFSEYAFYSCGPPGMVAAMAQLVRELGVPSEQLKTENFEGYE